MTQTPPAVPWEEHAPCPRTGRVAIGGHRDDVESFERWMRRTTKARRLAVGVLIFGGAFLIGAGYALSGD